MHKLLTILFPFRAKYAYLRAYWWHRLFVVVFFVITGALPFVILTSTITGYFDCTIYGSIESCDVQALFKNIGAVPFAFFLWLFTESNFVFPIAHMLGILTATLMSSYILQIIYYKVLIYIIFGSREEKAG